MRRLNQLSIFLIALLLLPAISYAVPGLTYHGKILKPGGLPLEDSSVDFHIQIRSPLAAGDCLIYDETQNLDMTSSNGLFVLTIGQGTRVGAGVDGGHSLEKIFANRGSLTGLTCAGGTYVKGAADVRRLVVSFDDGSGWQNLPISNINYIPNAIEASQVAGYGKDQLLRVADGVVATEFSGANWTALWDLITGASTVYSKADGSNFNPTASVNLNNQKIIGLADPTLAQDAATKNYADTRIGGKNIDVSGVTAVAGNGNTLIWDQGTNKWVTGAVSDSSKLPLAGGTMTGAILMGGYSVTNIGHVLIADQGTLYLGKFTAAQETTLITTPALNNTTDRGRTWFNTTTGKMRYWDGTAVQDVASKAYVDSAIATAGASTQTAAVAAANAYSDGKLVSKNLAVPAVGQDQQSIKWDNTAGNWVYFTPSSTDNTKVPLAGGTMTGTLVLSSDPTANLDAATKQYVTSVVSAAGGSFITKDGLTALTADWDIDGAAGTGFKITGLAAPTLAADAVNKTYADARETAAKTYADGKLVSKNLAVPVLAQDGQSIRWNNTANAWEYFTAGAGSGTVSSVTSINSDIGVATTTTTPVLTLNVGTGASQIVKLNASAELPAVSGVNLTALNASSLASGTVADARLSANVALKSYVDAADLKLITKNLAQPVAGDDLKVIRWNNTSGNFEYATDSTTDSTKLPLAGGTMTGAIVLAADPAAAMQPATKQYSDGKLVSKTLAVPVLAQDGQSIRWNNTSGNWEYFTAGSGSGTVSSVTSANTDASYTNTTTTPVLTINTGTGANQIVKLNGSAELPAVSGVNLTALNASSLASGTIADARLSSNVALKSYVDAADLKLITKNLAQPVAGDDLKVIRWNQTAGNFEYAVDASTDSSKLPLAGGTMSGAIIMGNNQITGLAAPTLGGDAVNKAYADGKWLGNTLAVPAAGQVGQSVRWNAGNTAWEYFTPSTGTVTGVTSANADIGVGGTAAAPVLTLNSGTGNDQIVKLDGSAKLPAVDGSALTNLNASNLATGTVADARLSANVALKSYVDAADLKLITKNLAQPAAGDDLKVIRWNNTSGNFEYATDSTTDSTKLPLAGGTMTGAIVLAADPAAAMQPATKQYSDGKLVSKTLAVPVLAQDGQSIRWNNTSGNWEYFTAGSGSGTVSSVTSANTDASYTNTTTTPVLTINTGTGNNQIVKLNGSAELPAVSGVNLTALNASSLASGTVADARLSANVALKSYVDAADLKLITKNLAQPAAGDDLKVIRWNQTAGQFEYVAPTSGTVTGVTSANADIGVGGTAAAPVLTLNSGTANNQIVKLNASAELPAVSGVNLTALNASNLASGTVADARLSANVALKSYADANLLGQALATPVGQAGKAIRWNAGNTAWEYFTPATGTGDFLKDGTIAMTGQLQAIPGTQAAPGITFDGDEDTGFFQSGTGQIAISVDNAQRFFMNGGGYVFWGAGDFHAGGGTVYTPTSGPVSAWAAAGNDSAADGAASMISMTARNSAFTYQNAYYGVVSNAAGNSPTIVWGQQTGAATYQERMRIDSSGNVGIGTSSPNQILTVEGVTSLREVAAPTATANYGKIYVKSADSKLYYMDDAGVEIQLGAAFSIADDSLNFDKLSDTLALDASTDIAADGAEVLSITNGGTGDSFLVNDATGGDTTPFVINASGSVGVGVASPGNRLDVRSGGIDVWEGIAAYSVSGALPTANALNLNNGISSDTANVMTRYLVRNANSNNQYSFLGAVSTAGGGSFEPSLIYKTSADGTTFTEKFRIAPGGNVGIGTASPNQLLTVEGVTSLRETTAPSLTANYGKIYVKSADSKLYFMDDSGVESALYGASSLGADTVDFTELKDSMALDASTDIAASGTNVLSITNGGTGDSFVVNDATGGDTTPFVVDAAGNVGIGRPSPSFRLDIGGTSAASDRKIGVNGTQVLYLPDQGTLPGSIFYGNGGSSVASGGGNTGWDNTGVGITALNSLTFGYANTAVGSFALNANTTGNANSAFGYYALKLNVNGIANVAVGSNALNQNTSGSGQVAIGSGAGSVIANGSTANATSGNSIYIGSSTKALADGDTNEVVIGYNATGNGSNTVTLGNALNTKTILTGNVGIGTVSPNQLLTVEGVTSLRETTAPTLTANYGKIYVKSADSKLYFMDDGGVETALGGAASLGADTVDFTELKDAMTLDASTDIAVAGTNVLSITNTGTGNSFVVNDQAADTTPFVVDASGNTTSGGTMTASGFVQSLAGATANTFNQQTTINYSAATVYTASSGAISSPGGKLLTLNNTSAVAGNYTGLQIATGSGAANAYLGVLNPASGESPAIVIGQRTGPTAYNERMRIDESGQVAIGTATANALLTVEGVTSLRETAAPSLTANYGKVYVKSADSKLYFMDDAGVEVQLGASGVAGIAADSVDFTELKDSLALDASTDIAATGTNVLSITNGGTGNSFVVNDATGGDTSPFVIDQNGNVGIGTTAPGRLLDVGDGTGQRTARIYSGDAGVGDNAPVLSLFSLANREAVVALSGNKLIIGNTSGLANYQNATLASAANITIDTTGNVGIGTTAPVMALDVVGTARGTASSASSSGVVGTNTATSGTNYGVSGNSTGANSGTSYGVAGYALGSGTGTNIGGYFSANNASGANYALITGVGNVGIGTAAPTAKLSVAGGDANINGITVGLGGGSIAANAVLGGSALALNTTGASNAAVGSNSLANNTTGNFNTALGATSLKFNTTGLKNSAVGYQALARNVGKTESTAIGYMSMANSDDTTANSSSANTAIGAYSLVGGAVASANTGTTNTAIGYSSLNAMTSGSGNIGVGFNSGSLISTGSYNVVIGSNDGTSIATSSNNILLADGAGNERIRIISSGNVGIGTASPNQLLTVEGVTSLRETTAPSLTANYGKVYVKSADSKLYFMDDSGVESALYGASSLGADTVDFTELKDSMALDASTAITAPSGQAYSLLVSNEGTGDSFRVDDQLADTSPFVVDSAGKVGIGIAAPNYNLQVDGADQNTEIYVRNKSSTATRNPAITVRNYHGAFTLGYPAIDLGNFGGTSGTTTATAAGATVGNIIFRAHDGATSQEVAEVKARTGASYSATDLEGYLMFTTRDALEAAASEKMRIDQTGKVSIGTQTANELLTVEGSTSLRELASAPSNTANYGKIYVKSSDSKLYFKDDGGVETQLGGVGSLGADTVDFTEMKDSMVLDASTEIKAPTGQAYALTVTNEGTGDSFVVNDQATPDTTNFTIDNAGSVGIGVAPGTSKVKVAGVIESTSGGVKFPDGTTQTTATQPFVAGGTFVGALAASQVLMQLPLPIAINIPINCTGSRFEFLTAATASTTVTLSKCTGAGFTSCTAFGTAVVSAAGKVASFTCASATSFTAGTDSLVISGPASADATAGTAGWAIYGTR